MWCKTIYTIRVEFKLQPLDLLKPCLFKNLDLNLEVEEKHKMESTAELSICIFDV